MEKKTIGQFIAALRRANGLTQKQLAEQLNVSDKAVSRWERDECAPDLSLIPVIADLFGVTSDEILRGERKQPEPAAEVEAAMEVTTEAVEQPLTYTVQPDPKAAALRTALVQEQAEKLLRTTLVTVSAVSGGLGMAAIITSALCNFLFSRPRIGFGAACVICLIGVILQVVFSIRAQAKADELLDEDRRHSCKKMLNRVSRLGLYALIAAAAACAPLYRCTAAGSTALPGGVWLCCGAASVLCVGQIVCVIRLLIHPKRVRRWIRDGFVQKTKRPFAVILAALLLLTMTAEVVVWVPFVWEVTDTKPENEVLNKLSDMIRTPLARYHDTMQNTVTPWLVFHSEEEYELFLFVTAVQPDDFSVHRLYQDYSVEYDGTRVTVSNNGQVQYTVDIAVDKAVCIKHSGDPKDGPVDISLYREEEWRHLSGVNLSVIPVFHCIYWLEVLAVWLLYRLFRRRSKTQSEA